MAREALFRLPNDTQRAAVIGRTGSGKTLAALWHLSKRNFDSYPWLILDYKTDESINSIERAEHIGLEEEPKRPGIYIVHPLPGEEAETEKLLWTVWRRGSTGIYADEAYMIGDNQAFEACLTQGRSKHIPMIILTQRPAWLSRFVFSEADFFQLFHLNDKRDRKTVEAFMPSNTGEVAPNYHSLWYDVGKNRLTHFLPVPPADRTLDVINNKLKNMRRNRPI